jgi:hypothetical protein
LLPVTGVRQVNGIANCVGYVHGTRDYTLTDRDIASKQTPVLLLEGEGDAVFAGQASKIAAGLTAPHEHVLMRSADGAGAHCHESAMFLLPGCIHLILAAGSATSPPVQHFTSWWVGRRAVCGNRVRPASPRSVQTPGAVAVARRP